MPIINHENIGKEVKKYMIKKLIATAMAGATMLSVAGVAGAWWKMPSPEIEVENEHTNVTTIAKAEAETGEVSQMGGWYSKVSTGDVYGVQATALSQVNMTKLPTCAVCGFMGGEVEVENEHTRVTTIAEAEAETGEVKQMSFWGTQKAYTGNVSWIGANATSVVNYTEFGVN